VLVLELGANDGLRGLALDMAEKNLSAIAAAARQQGARVLVVGMQIPPNYGRAYTDRFGQMFVTVAKQYDAVLVPFLMAGMAQDRSQFQADGMHPIASAQPALFNNVWRALEPML
jgi:acyl-CoA thioesterase-1